MDQRPWHPSGSSTDASFFGGWQSHFHPPISALTRPVVWAVDAFSDEPELTLRSAAAIRSLFPDARIIPVYILSRQSFFDQGYSLTLTPALKPRAHKSLANHLSILGRDFIAKPIVLIERSSSKNACAAKLLKFARRVHATAIAIGCHGRKGLVQVLSRTFSEAICSQSNMPIITAGPEVICGESLHPDDHQKPTRALVFATDFSSGCEHAFDEILSLAARQKYELHLFHKKMSPLQPVVESGVHIFGGGWVSSEAQIESLGETEERARTWNERASQCGVKTVVISEKFRESAPQAIINYLRCLDEAAVAVALVSKKFKSSSLGHAFLGQTFLGRTIKEVMRMSLCPVYLFPSR